MAKKYIQSKQEASYYRGLKKLVKRANQRILTIERTYGKDTWGISTIKKYLDNDLLDAWTKKGRIRLNKSMNLDKLEKIKNITDRFLNSEVSTLRGIKKVKSGILEKVSQDAPELADEEIEDLYKILHDENIKYLGRYTQADSDVLIYVSDAIEKRMSEDEFISYIETYLASGNDEFTKNRIKNIYSKIISKRI